MKNKKYTIAAIALILLLAAGTLILTRIQPRDVTQKTGSETADSYPVFTDSAEDLASVEVATDSFTITAVNLGRSDWTIDGENTPDISHEKAYALAATVSNLTSSERYEANNNLAEYGLEKPAVTVKITRKDGNVEYLYIGGRSPVSGDYFIQRSEDDAIYVMHSYKYEILTQPLSYYSEFDRFAVNAEDITGVRIERGDGAIELKHFDEIDKYTARVWEMISPYKSAANDDYVDDKIINKIAELSLTLPVDVPEDAFDEVQAAVTVKIAPYDTYTGETGDEYEEVFTIGRTERDGTYLKYRDKGYKVSSDSVSFANDKAFNIVSKKQMLVSIERIKNLKIEYDDTTADVDVTKTGDNKYDFRLNGKEVPRSETQDMYSELVDMSADGEYEGEEMGETVIKFTFGGREGIEDTMIEVKRLDDISCAIVRNGKADFTIRKSKIEAFKEKFDSYLSEFGDI